MQPVAASPALGERPRLTLARTIPTCLGTGTGPTRLASFDAALRDAGIANYNLLILSSVIPPGSIIATGRDTLDPSITGGDWGDRLYVVMAEKRLSTRGAEAWAGIGWVQDHTGKGVFVEHEGSCEEQVRRAIDVSLDALADGRPEEFGEPRMVVKGAVCEGEPACALVAAVFESQPWS